MCLSNNKNYNVLDLKTIPYRLWECEAGSRWATRDYVDNDGDVCWRAGHRSSHKIKLVRETFDCPQDWFREAKIIF